MSIWEWTTLDRISRPSSTTAADVSSQDASIPTILIRLIVLGLGVLFQDARFHFRIALLNLRLDDLERRLELEIAEAFGRRGLLALRDALVAPRLHQLGVLVLRHLDLVVRRDAVLFLPFLAVHARPVRGVVA